MKEGKEKSAHEAATSKGAQKNNVTKSLAEKEEKVNGATGRDRRKSGEARGGDSLAASNSNRGREQGPLTGGGVKR